MSDPIFELLRELRPAEAERTHEIFPQAQRAERLRLILAGSPWQAASVAAPDRRRRHRRPQPGARRRRGGRGRRAVALWASGAAAAAAAALIVLLSGSAGVPTSAAVAFSMMPGGTIVAKVTEPFAAQRELDAAFAAHGYHITVQLIPASPSIVGTVLSSSSDGPKSNIEALQGGHCVTGGGGCAVGVRIPAGFEGEASIALGRPARPGEAYESQASAFAPGEVLHCSGLLGATVGEAAPLLASKKLEVVWNVEHNVAGHSVAVNTGNPPRSGYVWDISMIRQGEARAFIKSAPPSSDPAITAHDQLLNRGCRSGGNGRLPHRER